MHGALQGVGYRHLVDGREEAESVDGSFLDAVHLLSRENRWLDTAQRDKRYFQGLCEGWLTCPKEDVSEQAHSVQQ